MPYTIRKSKKKGDPRPYKIVKTTTGEVVGTSKTRKDAIGSIAHREDAAGEKSSKKVSKRKAKK